MGKTIYFSEKIYIDNVEIPLALQRSNRRSLSIEVTSEGIVLRMPLLCPKSAVDKLLNAKAHWILSHYLAAVERNHSGKNTDLPISPALEKSSREKARAAITPLAHKYADLLGVTFGTISIKDQKTRWGSCSSKCNLNFNFRLIFAPDKVLEYVVIHEVCHLIHMDHSPAFWQTVEQLMPDYRIYKSWLKKNGQKLAHSSEKIPL